MSSDSFCILPWIHLNTDPDGSVKPCCAYNHGGQTPADMNLNTSSLQEVWNCETMRTLRQKFLNGEYPTGCAACESVERLGDPDQVSYRQHMNKMFQHHIPLVPEQTLADGTVPEMNLRFFDFRFSNLCNFKCRMCNPTLSSSWYDDLPDEIKAQKTKFLNGGSFKTDLFEYVERFIPVVEEIYFAGGEPLIMPEHYQILDMLLKHGRTDVRLRYNTNGSTLSYKNYDLLSIWEQFPDVSLFVSIDGTGANAEYTRSGTDWQRVEKNLVRLLASKNVVTKIDITVNIMNIFHIPELLDRLHSHGVNFDDIIVKNVIHPQHLRTCILPETIKQRVRLAYHDHIVTTPESIRAKVGMVYNMILDEMDQEPEQLEYWQNRFYGFTQYLDLRRNESFAQAVPDLAEWYSELHHKNQLELLKDKF